MAAKTDFNKPPKITFEEAVEKMEGYLERLKECPPSKSFRFSAGDGAAVYVFYEGKKAMYVGRTDRLRGRIQEHGRPGSGHNSAPFAYNMAKCDARDSGLKVDGIYRNDLCKVKQFIPFFRQSKERVCNMQVRFVAIPDPHLQVLFEVYAALKLKAKWTTFSNS